MKPKPLKLLNEQACSTVEKIEEAVVGSTETQTYISGVFLGAEKKNRNGRIYPKPIIEREVAQFRKLIESGEAVGELDHPEDAVIHSKELAIRISQLDMQDDFAVGKALILTKMPNGQMLKGLIDSGVKMGVSSRGVGNLTSESIVCDDFHLITIDAVYMPSCPDAYVNAVNESYKWVLDESTNLYIEKSERFSKANDKFNKQISKTGSKDIAEAFDLYMKELKKLI